MRRANPLALRVGWLLVASIVAGVNVSTALAQTRPAPPAARPVAPATGPVNGAILQALDKVTARVSRLEVTIGQTVRFGTLEIAVRACNQRPPDEPPDASAFVQILDQPPGREPAQVFSGWMFQASPALNSLEHPVYDVTLLDCRR